jgi:ABC-type transport system involved in multi-copper enzyme maturation permease subunit
MNPLWLVSAEIMKIRTTGTWRLFLGGVVLLTVLALVRGGAAHHYELYPQLDRLGPADRAEALSQAAHAHTHAGLAAIAADMTTAGQFLSVLFALIIGVLLVTNEHYHRTATVTFVTNPRRGLVIAAKLAAAACFGALFWLVSTVISLAVTPIYLRSQHVSVALTDQVVVRSVSLSLLAYVLWAVFGLGLGTLVRSQVGAVVVGLAGDLGGAAAVLIVGNLVYAAYHHVWVLSATVIAPAVASLVMITPGRAFDHAPPQWVGLGVMVAYAAILTVAGVALTRRRDVT